MKIVIVVLHLLIFFSSLAAKPKRYIHSLNSIRFLKAKFGLAPNEMPRSCGELHYLDHIVLGTVMPKERSSLISNIDESFVKWYVKCVKEFSRFAMSVSQRRSKNEYCHNLARKKSRLLGNELWAYLLKKYKGHVSCTTLRKILSYPWEYVPKHIQKKFVKNLLRILIGPKEVMKELRYIGKKSVIKGKPKNLEELARVILDTTSRYEQRKSIKDIFVLYSIIVLTSGDILEY